MSGSLAHLPPLATGTRALVLGLGRSGLSAARYLDRKEIVRSTDGYKLEVAPNDWWGEPLNTMLSRVIRRSKA